MSKRIANAESDPGDILALEIIHYRQSGRGRQFLESALRKAEALRNKSVGAKRDHLSAKIKEAKAFLRKKNPGMFGPEAVAKAKRVTKIRRVRDKNTGQLGEITGSAPQGWVKVKWDNRDKATLIKRSEIALARGRQNPETENQKAWRKGYEHGYKGLNSRPDYPKVGLAGSYRLGYEAGERRRKGKAQPRKNPGKFKVGDIVYLTMRYGTLYEWGNPFQVVEISGKGKQQRIKIQSQIQSSQSGWTDPQYLKHKQKRTQVNPKREAKTSKDAFGVTHENPAKISQQNKGAYEKLVKEFGEKAARKAVEWYVAEHSAQFRRGVDAFRFLKDNEYLWRSYRKNPSVVAIAEKFQGKTDGAIEEFHAASSAPANLARAGKLVFLKVGAKTFRLPTAMVAIAPNERLWIVSKRAPVFSTKARPGEGLDVGEITQICYETAKQHIGDGKRFEYVHEFGEDGGKRPHLIIDHEGMPILHGGDYKIKAEGIVN